MHSLYITVSILATVSANPIQPRNILEARDNNNSFLSPKAWIPIVVVILVLSLVALTTWSKGAWQKSIIVLGNAYGAAHIGVPSGSNPVGAGRELTAEQLVGSINGTDLPASSQARQTRRTRRPQRTPSQVSVTSLPAYNKEPGEEELVIFRGRDMEDMPAAVIATPADEDDDSLNSQDRSQVSRYSPMPITSNSMPLLHHDDPSGDLSLQSLPSPNSRPSLDSSLQETSSLMRVDSNLPRESSDERGQAPPYFEVVDHIPELHSGVPTTQTPSTSSSTSPRRSGSGFRTFLNRMSMMSHTPEHRRADSNQSVSTSSTHRRDRSTQNHRASPSASSMFRTISRQRSSQTLNNSVRLNSPSLISLNSISSPLSHTLIRTEFTYPKSGPTPEQLKVISSRENFSRFGVPYGPDAIAFAASSSRQDLEPPPPGFEASSSQLRPDSSDNAADTQQEVRPSISEPTLGGQVVAATRSSLPVDTPPENVVDTSSIAHTVPPSSPSTSKDPNPISHSDDLSSSSSSSSSSLPKTSPTDPSPSSTSTHPQLHLLPPINVISEFGSLHPSSTSSPLPKDAATGFSARSESRTSNHSFQSYATASESLGRGYISTVDAGRSTPKLGDRHVVADEVAVMAG